MYIGKTIKEGSESRLAVKAGIDKGANIVKATLGPFGTNVLTEKGLRITNDGAKILKELTLDDEIEDLGLSKLKEACAKSNDEVGDGSTTIVTLVQAILKESLTLLGNGKSIGGKISTADFIKKIKAESAEIIEKLQEKVTPVISEEELIKSAIVSVEDKELGEMIGKAQWELGPDGFIIAEEVPERTTTIERVHGIKFDNGFGASYVMNNAEKQSLEVSDVRTILTNHTIQSLEELKPVLEQLLKIRVKNVAIIARAFTDVAIQDCAQNIKQGFNIYPINAPYTDSKEVMLDLASILGGQFMDSEMTDLASMQLSDVGFAEQIRAKRYEAIITGKNGIDSEKVQARIARLKEQLSGSSSEFETKMLQSRIAQLENGFSVIKVGAESETERKRKYDKVEDAVNAVRAALQEGTVKGAGIAFKEIADELPESYILKRPLTSIYEQVMANAPEDFVVEDWVRDPFKVLRVALTQAVSVAGELATVSGAVHTTREKCNHHD